MASRGIKTRRRSGGSAGHRTSALLRGNGGASGAAQPRRGLGAPGFFLETFVQPPSSRSINRWNRQQHQETSPDNRFALSSWTQHHCTSSSHRIASCANVCPAHAPCQAHRPVPRSQQQQPRRPVHPPGVTASISGLGVARGSVASAIRFLIGQSVGLCTTLRWGALAAWVVVTKRKRASQ